MNNGDIVLAPRAPAPESQMPPSASALDDALHAAREVAPGVAQARALRDGIAGRLAAEAARRGRWPALPPAAAAVLSLLAAAAATACLPANSAFAADGPLSIALAADIAALGAVAVVAARTAADRGLAARLRTLSGLASLAALACLAAFAAEAAARRGPPEAIAVAGLARTEAILAATLADARRAFDDEVAEIAGAAARGPDTPPAHRHWPMLPTIATMTRDSAAASGVDAGHPAWRDVPRATRPHRVGSGDFYRMEEAE